MPDDDLPDDVTSPRAAMVQAVAPKNESTGGAKDGPRR